MPHTSTPRRTPALAALLILLLAAVGLAACGGSSPTTTPTAAAATTTAPGGTSSTPGGTSSTSTTPGAPGARTGAFAARFAAMRECLAKKGINLPPRTPGAPGFLGGRPALPKGVTQAQYAEALKSCGGGGFAGRGFAGAGHFNRAPGTFGNSPRFRQALAGFAACLRQNGVNIGEPNTSGKGPIFNTKGVNTAGPQFRAAEAKCRTALTAALRPQKAVPGAAGPPVKG